MLTGIMKFVVGDTSMCVSFNRMNRSRLTLAVTNSNQQDKETMDAH